uniref:Putative secreted protein n=1 Tax=Anopheles triannulatus TaxID=58253 RepID=A0A2M4B290_9DIPT
MAFAWVRITGPLRLVEANAVELLAGARPVLVASTARGTARTPGAPFGPTIITILSGQPRARVSTVRIDRSLTGTIGLAHPYLFLRSDLQQYRIRYRSLTGEAEPLLHVPIIRNCPVRYRQPRCPGTGLPYIRTRLRIAHFVIKVTPGTVHTTILRDGIVTFTAANAESTTADGTALAEVAVRTPASIDGRLFRCGTGR